MTFLGREISNYIHIDGELVGFGAEPDFQKDVLQVVVENEEIDKNDISDNENHEVIRMQLDLTATTGATKTGQIHDTYQKLTLNEFNGEIYLFTRKKSVTDFSVNFNHLPNNADKWVSPIIEIERAIEEIGGAHIDGHISVQVIFSHSRINHLILTLIIYVGGQSWSTRNWPHNLIYDWPNFKFL